MLDLPAAASHPSPVSDALTFNAEDRAAELNGGSYIAIPARVRQIVNREFEAFVLGVDRTARQYAIETSLWSDITVEQKRLAKQAGFQVEKR